ncbi:MAG: bifunctional precorrin-2 dehydrogenase/sirohydrochlorin ferrochelatase [Flavobacteriaceae bacterium]|nr:bifunctional precorrin-2 dehydrogenase/sirohydrochlorin ferrochelatase [Flavobacteriaceae bacterium]
MDKNTLYPVFLKLSQLEVLIVGGGFVGYEKLSFMLKSSPDARVTLVSEKFSDVVRALAESYRIKMIEKRYDGADLLQKNIVIAATNNRDVNAQIYKDAKAAGILVNVADTPDLCDFYLGGIVTKGNLKLGISTNGKSPTFAKRFRELMEDALPEEVDELLESLHLFRKTIEGDFEEKIKILHKHTEVLLTKKSYD